MSPLPFQPARSPQRRRIWRVAAFIGACGTVITVWFQEIISHAQEVIGLVLLPVLAGVIYALDILMFRSRRLTRADPPREPHQGGGK